MEMAQEVEPTARIDAIDISDAQYPAPGWVPQNIHCSTGDRFEPFAKDRLGRRSCAFLFDQRHIGEGRDWLFGDKCTYADLEFVM